MKGKLSHVGTVAVLILCFQATVTGGKYYGKEIGQLTGRAHGVAGTVYAVDESTILITGFSFDGTAPDTFLWVGTSDNPSTSGKPLFHNPSKEKLGAHNNAEISAPMPPGTKITDVKWISVWCRFASANFGEVYIPADFVAPACYSLGPLATKSHEVSASNVWILDSTTLRFLNFTYNGQGPDTYFWAGNTSEPNNDGFWLYWSSRRETILPEGTSFSGEDVTVNLPAPMTIFDITYVSVWCQQFVEDFGSITFDPSAFNVPAAGVRRDMPQRGKRIGHLVNTTSGVAGLVFAVNQSTFLIEDFSYNGLEPDVVFWVGLTDIPSVDGIPLYLNDSNQKLEAHAHDTIVVSVPTDTKITDYKWLSVWCRSYEVSLGHTVIPADLELPYQTNLGALPTFAHDVKADSVWVLDSKTVLFVNFSYDGKEPDTFFTAGKTHSPDDNGIKLNFRYGNNQQLPVGTVFNGENVTVTIPGGYSIFDFTYVGVWCYQFMEDFGHVDFEGSLLNVPVALKEDRDEDESSCKVLIEDEFQVRWQILGSDILIWLKGRLDEGQYMAFGLSGSDTRTLMDGSDVVVVWQKKGRASDIEIVDYNLHSKQQCTASGEGACEDTAAGGEDNIEDDMSFYSNDGIQEFFFRRKLDTGDPLDKVIPTDRVVYISWAVGEINPDGRVAKHTKAPSGDVKINFGTDRSVCPGFKKDTGTHPVDVVPWPAQRLNDVQEFRLEIGQNGGKRGYQSVTGKVGWGLAWYVNGLLIPEIYLVRGVNYSFTVFGGESGENSIYHPFYITDNAVGGYTQQSEAERKNTKILAGPHEGPLCSWNQREASTSPDDFDSFAAYKKELVKECVEPNSTGTTFWWVPNIDTPDHLYYQCYTHRHLGWKIHVTDELYVFTEKPKTTSSAPAFFLPVVLLVASPLVGQLLI